VIEERNSHTLTITFHQTSEGLDKSTTRSQSGHNAYSISNQTPGLLAVALVDHYGRDRARVILEEAKETIDRGVA
jgi:hypothetical protein